MKKFFFKYFLKRFEIWRFKAYNNLRNNIWQVIIMSRYKLCIFDMDGTILDTLQDLYLSTNFALKKNSLPERELEEVKNFVGNGIRKLIERAVPENSDEETINRVFNDFNGYYKIHCADNTKAYPDIKETLLKLKSKGILTAVLSNKADYAVKELSDRYFEGVFDISQGAKENIRIKPYPDAVFEIMKKLDVKKENTVYIGDSEVDIKTAENAGVDCISVDWGFKTRQFLINHGAKRIVSTSAELFKEIRG